MLSSLLALAFAAAAARLDPQIRPSRYDLALTVDPAAGQFSGTETIALNLGAPADRLRLHAVDLEVSGASFEVDGKRVVAKVLRGAVDADEQIVLLPDTPLPAGPAVLHLAFAAKLRTDLRGLYLAKTRDGLAEAFTQFEASDARRAFPCFDEPAYKAVFAVQLTVPAELSAVSNGAQLSDAPGSAAESGKAPSRRVHTLRFAETPLISSYLLAIGVGKFEIREGQAGTIPVRVLTPPGQGPLGAYALQVALEVLPWYQRWFGIPYPYAKLDLVGAPEFAAGAMENAGAIFFRDTALLLDDGHASVAQQQRVASVVAHEIAHQWFGDLVTMAWWDDIWLNESFASLMDDWVFAELRPQWTIWDDQQAQAQRAMAVDALPVAHPVHDPEETNPDNAQFPELLYQKGEAVLRMLAHALGEEKFREGIHAYLSAHALGNATEADLWTALQAAQGDAKGAGQGVGPQPVASLARSWLDQPGLPLVALHRGAAPKLTQTRLEPPGLFGDRAEELWEIPVCLRAKGGEACVRLTAATASLAGGPAAPLLRGRGPVVANAGGLGYYRVLYEAADLKALGAAAAGPKPTLDSGERLALIADAWELAREGLVPLPAAVGLARRLAGDGSRAVAAVLIQMLGELAALARDDDRPKLAGFAHSLLAPWAKQLGWTAAQGETPDRSELRPLVLDALDRLGNDAATGAEGDRRFVAWQKNPAGLDPSVLPAAFAMAARHADQRRWDELRSGLANAATPELKQRFEVALGQLRDPDLLQKSLAMALTAGDRADSYPVQDLGYLFGAMFQNPAARDLAWSFLRDHWTELAPKFPGYLMERQLFPGLGQLCEDREKTEVADLFLHQPLKGGDRLVRRVEESIDRCVRVRALLAPALGPALKSR